MNKSKTFLSTRLGPNKDGKPFNIFSDLPLTKDQGVFFIGVASSLNILFLLLVIPAMVYYSYLNYFGGLPVYLFDPLWDFVFIGFISIFGFLKHDNVKLFALTTVFFYLFVSLFYFISNYSEWSDTLTIQKYIFFPLILFNFKSIQYLFIKNNNIITYLISIISLIFIFSLIFIPPQYSFYKNSEVIAEYFFTDRKSSPYSIFILENIHDSDFFVCENGLTSQKYAFTENVYTNTFGYEQRLHRISIYTINRENIFTNQWEISSNDLEKKATFKANESFMEFNNSLRKNCVPLIEKNAKSFIAN